MDDLDDALSSQQTDDDIAEASALGEALISAILTRAPAAEVHALLAAGAPVWYQNDEEGISPLHAAAYVEDAELVQMLIAEGGVWNAVNYLGNTAGDIALSFNDEKCYTLIRDAGLRAELLFTLLGARSMLAQSQILVLRAEDSTAAGSREAFLSSKLRFTTDEHGQDVCLVKAGGEEVGVMMGWERGIMEETVRSLCGNHKRAEQGLKILNIGFGLGIVDSLFQELPVRPSVHIIVEAHPDVLEYMRTQGWYDKPGVKILEGKWQDFVDKPELLKYGGFDVVYTDTFSEDYQDLRQFFGKLPTLLSEPEARFSFFNGLGATNVLFYDVYTRLAELHLADVGVDVAWRDVDVAEIGRGKRWGATREYFRMPVYRFAIGTLRQMDSDS